MKSFFKKLFEASNIIAFVALIISMLVFWNDCSNEKKLKDLQFGLDAVNYKPFITISNFRLTDIEEPNMDFDKMSSNLNVNIHFDIENKGNNLASIIFVTCQDTISGTDIARRRFYSSLKDKKIRTKKINRNNYYDRLNILPGEKRTESFNHTIHAFKDNTFTIHVLVLYENEIGNLYDSYAWFRLRKTDSKWDMLKSDSLKIAFVQKIKDVEITKIDSNFDFRVYSREGRDNVKKILLNYE